MLAILKQIKVERKYAEFYTDVSDSMKFVYGLILAVNENYVAISLLSPGGLFDGVLVKQTNEILRVKLNGKYEKKMQRLCSLHDKKHPEYLLDDDAIPATLLSIAKQKCQIVSLEISNSGYEDIVGFVDEIGKDFCKIKEINPYGEEDGNSYVPLDCITQISCNSLDERRLFRLWQLTC